jgi:aspartate aminotransferase/aminotransferase
MPHNPDRWIAERMHRIEVSGIRKVFDLSKSLKDPVNLSIGQPHFDVPEPIKAAAKAVIDQGANGYTVTQGIPNLRQKIQDSISRKYPKSDRQVLVTSGTSGGLLLALSCIVNPGDEVVLFDPYFLSYLHLVTLAGGKAVFVDTYPDFRIDVNKVHAALTPRTKAIIVNSPGNPTGVLYSREEMRDLATLAKERGVLLLSDEIYSGYCYGGVFCSPAEFNDDVLVFDGFSKSYGMTGWRLGYAHGPRAVVEEMTKLQQFTFVCAPSMVQHAGIVAWDFDYGAHVDNYKRKCDQLYEALKSRYELTKPGGAFYMFPKAPWGTGTDFVTEAIRHNLLIIPGITFSTRDTHFRLSFSVDDTTLDRGIEILNRLARR